MLYFNTFLALQLYNGVAVTDNVNTVIIITASSQNQCAMIYSQIFTQSKSHYTNSNSCLFSLKLRTLNKNISVLGTSHNSTISQI